MPYLKTPEAIQADVIAALARFTNDSNTKPATMAVLWFEPEHACWGLYLSTQPNADKSTPAEFDYQNYKVGDIEDADEMPEDELFSEVDAFTRRLAREVPQQYSPPWWGVQVAFDYFATWETTEGR